MSSKTRLSVAFRGTLTLLQEAGVRWADDGCYRLAASLAFYALFSIFPLLLLSVTVFGFFLGHDPSIRQRLLGSVANATTPEFRVLLEQTLDSMQTHLTARGVGAAVGLVTLLFGASSVFSELQFAFNAIWRVKPPPSKGMWSALLEAAKDKAISFVVVVAAGLALLVSLTVTTLLTAIGGSAQGASVNTVGWVLLETILSFAFLTGLFAAMFRMLPRADVRWRDVLGGATFTALLFTVLKHLLAWYLGHLGSYAAYGAVGAVLGLLMWIYLASLFLFFGAECTRVYAERFGSLSKR